jgi:hypothetical protein
MKDKIPQKLFPRAARLYDMVIDEFETIHYSDEETYHILRYLTNMLESKEAELYKKLNERNSS